MKAFWRRRQKPERMAVRVFVDGKELPKYALRSGQRITKTRYDAGADHITVWVSE